MLAKAIIAGLLTALFIALPNKSPAPAHHNSVEPNRPEMRGQSSVQQVQAQLTSKRDEASPQPVKPTEPSGDEPEKPQAQAKVAVQTQVTGCEAYRHLISQYKWDTAVAMAVMQAESGCTPNRNNAGLNKDGSVDYGLMQVNSIHRHMVTSLEDLYDPATNISVAYRIYQGQGWQAWSVYNSGKYLRYL